MTIEGLNRELSSSETKAAFASFTSGLADVATFAINALKAVQSFTTGIVNVIAGVIHGSDDSLGQIQAQIQLLRTQRDGFIEQNQSIASAEVQAEIDRMGAEIASLENEAQNIVNSRDKQQTEIATANPETLKPDLEVIHLRQAQSRADSGSCEDARQAARMCTDVSTELASRTQEAERRAGIYAEYADKLEIELRAARGIIGKGG